MKELIERLDRLIKVLMTSPRRRPARTLTILGLPMPDAATQYRHQLPRGCKKFTIQTRDGSAFYGATEADIVTNTSSKDVFTFDAGACWSEDNLDLDAEQMLYFSCPSAGKHLEIIQWV